MFVGVSCGGEWWGLDGMREVERLGFDGLFTGEHLVYHRPVWDGVTMCAAMAAATQRISVGAAALIAPLRHPTLLAKELAGVDRIADGRLLVALGVGGDYPREFDAVGVPLDRRGRRTTETVEILKRYFSGERFSYAGEIFRLEDVSIDPPPARPGGPPLWIAGRGEATRRRAALLGDGFLPYMVTPERSGRWFAELRSTATAAGRELGDDYAFGAYVYVSLGDDPDEARRRGDAHLAWRYAEPRFLGDLAGKYAVAGRADDCVEALARFGEFGCSHLVLAFVRPDGSPALDTLRRAAEELLPRLRHL
jgi:alkanesulfonate monooxygenase SsuD/methylene tetrahydromethanopterin reductase-like flavin-dependent oxidoreductase (luciferase family)